MKLSVLMITYNHERYLRQALDSALMQDVDFDYEIVVGEDCSTDSTRAILMEYAGKHPDRFRLLLREKNLGAISNFYSTLEACRGQYVALLEGDDYWTCNQKLKKQVAFLDGHPDYAICFHNVMGHFEDGSQPDFKYVRRELTETVPFEELLRDNVIPTCSAVFRRGLVNPVPAWVFELKMADYPLHLLNAQHGKIAYFDQIMAVYRVHSAGVWTGLDSIERVRMNINMLEFLIRDLRGDQRAAARLALARRYWDLACAHESRGELAEARRQMARSLRTRVFTSSPSVSHKLKMLGRVWTPSLYKTGRRLYGSLSGSSRQPLIPLRPARSNPRLSVVIPAYNASRYLFEAVQSTLAQTFEDFECIVVDDGSTDRTPTILNELARRDGRIRPMRVPHGGIVEALNAGVREARGELIARMDADDICLAHRFETQVRYLDEHPECVAVGSYVMLVDPYGSPLWETQAQTDHQQIEAELFRGNGWAIFHPTAIIRRKAMLDVGAYRPEYQWSEDIDLFLRLAEVGRLANLPEALLKYRQHFSSVNRTKLQLQLQRTQRVLAEAYRRRGVEPPAAFTLDLGTPLTPYDQVRAWGRRAIINRNLRVARRHALAAVRLEPLRYESWSLMFHAISGW